MRIALYIIGGILAFFLAYYLFGLLSAGLLLLWQILLIVAAVGLTAAVVGGARRGRRALPLPSVKAIKADVPQTGKAQEKAEKKAERAAEKELRTLEATLDTGAAPPVRTVSLTSSEETPVQQTRRR